MLHGKSELIFTERIYSRCVPNLIIRIILETSNASVHALAVGMMSIIYVYT